jgi:hypothetical protein
VVTFPAPSSGDYAIWRDDISVHAAVLAYHRRPGTSRDMPHLGPGRIV